MLVLSRKCSENIVINGNIRIHVVSIQGNTVRLGIDAPREVGILRGELAEADELSYDNPATVSESPALEFNVNFSPEINT